MSFEEIIDFLATKEALIVLALIGLVLFVYFILWFLEYMKKHEEKKKLQNNTLELNKLVEEVVLKEQEEIKQNQQAINNISEEKANLTISKNVEKNEPINIEKEIELPTDVININNQKEEVIVKEIPQVELVSFPKTEQEEIKYKDEVYTKKEAKEELQRIKDELQKLELEDENDKNAKLTDFERSQEENAIISLDELLKKGQTLTIQNEERGYEDDGNEIISIKELEAKYRSETKPKEEVIELLEDDEVVEEKIVTNKNYETIKKPYTPSPVISPIYGISKKEVEPINKNITLELENTANFEKFDEEIRKTNKFLTELKELQQKLD